ncbi:hypothetical protein ACFFJY_09445 [Fictibacillus aquaticus]|uniref:Uncharacterized protein n=1 Tax=Fictibacillus aquaticus TaxID=2021314 RepID=A0A235FAY2_9BACL|nr:hypothetical protein [Fictibacillus aquaticus]OYD58496.1 hypothetical protein CGZ90_00930 [Fictibacillus aquaticus]
MNDLYALAIPKQIADICEETGIEINRLLIMASAYLKEAIEDYMKYDDDGMLTEIGITLDEAVLFKCAAEKEIQKVRES